MPESFLVIKERVSALGDDLAQRIAGLSARIARVEKDVAWASVLRPGNRSVVEARVRKGVSPSWAEVLQLVG